MNQLSKTVKIMAYMHQEHDLQYVPSSGLRMKTFPGPQVKGHHTAEVTVFKNLFDLVLQYRISNVWGSHQQAVLCWSRGAHTTHPCPFTQPVGPQEVAYVLLMLLL